MTTNLILFQKMGVKKVKTVNMSGNQMDINNGNVLNVKKDFNSKGIINA